MTTHGRKGLQIAAGLCIALVAAPAATAQGRAGNVSRQMAHAQELFAGHGLRPAGRGLTGTLEEGEEATLRLQLTAGVQYVISGVCDNACSDFDLRLADAAGNAVAEDVETDDTPIVRFTPQRTGVYVVSGVMSGCSQDPCHYGIGTYGGPSPVAAAARPATPRPAMAPPAAGRPLTGGVQVGAYACTEVVSIYAGSTYTSAGSIPNYTSTVQTRGSIRITSGNTYRVGSTSGQFSFDAATGAIVWQSGSLATPQVKGGRYGPHPQTRILELVVITSSGRWTCRRP
ncbi:MAG TPA: hypothetical protein VFH27_11255 [Longimicrobiaceae bacterium]|nr:hypothetical protein [Longimicrobiaceae bacterium]